MKPKYYASVLGIKPWSGFDECADWLHTRCDSQLEVCVGLAIVNAYIEAGKSAGLICSSILIREGHICFFDPYAHSPFGEGYSSAFLTCQHTDKSGVWDFCIHGSGDNGGDFGSATPDVLVDVDGYGVHRTKRSHDEAKLARASIPAIRVQEERFKDCHEMARAILFSSMWTTMEPMEDECIDSALAKLSRSLNP